MASAFEYYFPPSLKTVIMKPTRGLLSNLLSHIDYKSGKPQMVDVSAKNVSSRVAEAKGRVLFSRELSVQLFGSSAEKLPFEIASSKGPVFATAIIAGVQAAKKTSDLIPFCHNIGLNSCKIDISLVKLEPPMELSSVFYTHSAEIRCIVKCDGKTGVEMEALVGVSNAALCVYDMMKAVSHDMIVSDIQLVHKSGGKSNYVNNSL